MKNWKQYMKGMKNERMSQMVGKFRSRGRREGELLRKQLGSTKEDGTDILRNP